MSRREQLVDDAAEVAALLEHQDDVCGPDDVDERGGASDQDPPIRVVYDGGAQPCEVCGLNVTAQKIAETGHTRHPWHPED